MSPDGGLEAKLKANTASRLAATASNNVPTMADDSIFAPKYAKTHALVIGINNYAVVGPLNTACSDALAVAEYVRSALGNGGANVKVLLDEAATREAILKSFLSFAIEAAPDDRVLFFFAGHGHTIRTARKEIGFLVPVEGHPRDISTLLRWDELTRGAEVVPAKHVLFIVDACYGGLALTRALPPGSHRFLKDMLSRFARQVITAGKADEAVSDSGGPKLGHSVFTGHLLEGLAGGARSAEGVITANTVMAYVYDRVSKDPDSNQTPHFGFIDGDGDFVFEAPQLESLLEDAKHDKDVLVTVSEAGSVRQVPDDKASFATRVKDYLSEDRFRIHLADLAAHEMRAAKLELDALQLPMQGQQVTAEMIAERLRNYERVIEHIVGLSTLLARWASGVQRTTLTDIPRRLIEDIEPVGGLTVWLGLRWYPVDLVLHCAGIAALSAGNYDNLAAIWLSEVQVAGRATRQKMIQLVVDGMSDAVNAFRVLPGHETEFTPRSEYMFKAVQPPLEDHLYLGRDYEDLFDRYEVLQALCYADMRRQAGVQRVWGPVGRFGWKAVQGAGSDSYGAVVAEAEREGNAWAPLRSGLFGGSYQRFQDIARDYRAIISQLGWY